MREAVNELSMVISEHFHGYYKKDITVVLSTRDMLELVQKTDIARYDEASIKYDGDYHLVSSCVVGDTTVFFVEDIRNEKGLVKYDETDILILPIYLPQEIVTELTHGGYERVIRLTEDSTYEEMVKLIETDE
ncbi:hypothetical protein P4639_22690 [Priestia megaterium]|uniref:hypothetical protein n=1 Tax=Priestia megaterium TaxID=1404 RepID=UPI002E1CBDDE|nr:hypothetical protein [Priestia megaterium]